jgi:hypothetical protein
MYDSSHVTAGFGVLLVLEGLLEFRVSFWHQLLDGEDHTFSRGSTKAGV